MDMDEIGSWGKLVIVEDNESLADIYKTRLELIGYKCFVAYDGVEALDIIERERPSLVLLDLMVPKIAGDQILERIRESDWGRDIKVLIISNLSEADAPKGLRAKGISGYAVKSTLSNDDIDKLVDNILKPSGQTESTSLDEENPSQNITNNP
jgi:DNA-binding response OmpR family regulator